MTELNLSSTTFLYSHAIFIQSIPSPDIADPMQCVVELIRERERFGFYDVFNSKKGYIRHVELISSAEIVQNI